MVFYRILCYEHKLLVYITYNLVTEIIFFSFFITRRKSCIGWLKGRTNFIEAKTGSATWGNANHGWHGSDD
jgi:hypothetical protein